nr:hypothetical protein [uncultured Dongia sp.]
MIMRQVSQGVAIMAFVAVAHVQFTKMARADEPAVAIVEDTSGTVAGVEPLDLLRKGQQIALSAGAGLIISYLDSCQRENIRGGKVVIGRTQSDVAGGAVTRSKVSCDPVALALTPEQANQSATLVFREPDKIVGDSVAAEAKFALQTRRPIVIVPDLTEITVEDWRDKKTKWSVKVMNGIADITADRKMLDQGGVYRLVGGGKTLIFRIGKEATDAPLPLLKRVIRF